MLTLSIAHKEWREILRDRRSLLNGLFYGIWGPLVMGIALLAMARHQGELGPITIGARGADAAPSLAAFLHGRSVSIETVDDPEAAVRERRLAAAIIVDGDYAKRVSASRTAEITLLFNSTRPDSSRQAAHLRTVIGEYSRSLADTRLVVRGIAPATITPLRVVERDYATGSDRAGRAFATLPIFLLVAAFVGGMSVAADVAAGERERGSLESLLLHPVSRASIVSGKWIAVAATTAATVALAVAVSYGVLQHPRLRQLDLPIGLGVREAMTMLLVLMPLAAAASAVQLMIAFQTRTYKEAQTRLSMLIFVPMLPGFLFAFGSIEPSPWMAFAPMIGQHMLITDLVRGEPASVPTAVMLSAMTIAVTIAACWAAARQLDREAVLRRAGA
jgi:sodium transport system permease protein